MKLAGAFDIECANWTTYVVGVAVTVAGERLSAPGGLPGVFSSPAALTDALLAAGGTWWSWNGGRYDILCIAEQLRRRGMTFTVDLSGSSVTRLRCGALELRDAARLCPLPLDEACELAGLEPLPALGWACHCVARDCGGYCSISTREPMDRLAELGEYCARDAHAVLAVLSTLDREAGARGVELRGTIGATAWRAARDALALPAAGEVIDPVHWKLARLGYYGGRACVAQVAVPGATHYDLASAYPSALASTPLPVGTPRSLGGKSASAAFRRGTEGIYQATVTIGDVYLPPLPMRYAGGRLGWPARSTITGWWPANELRHAQVAGAKLERVSSCIVWDGRAVLFDELVADWTAARAAAPTGRGHGLGAWWRLLANALTGKLGEGAERDNVIVHPTRAPTVCDWPGPVSARAGCTRDRCTRKCGAWHAIDRWGEIWGAPIWRIGESSHVQWAAYLTAATRIAWHQGATAVGDALVYGYTDSIWTTGATPPGPVGDAPGAWAHKGGAVDLRIYGPGAYRYVDDRTGEVIVRMAGASGATARHWRDGGQTSPELPLEARGVLTFGEAAGRGKGLFRARHARRRAPGPPEVWVGDRLLSGDGRAYPATHEQLQARYVDHGDPKNPT